MINLCIPVLRRYDLLRGAIRSAQSGNVRPSTYYIIDNGQSQSKIMDALRDFDIHVKLHTPKKPFGVAESWNWFVQHVPEDRIISNDDVIFGPTSIEQLLASTADIVWAEECGFSCFVLRDSCVTKLGLFDETISPGYGYYEDQDYLQRLDGRGTRAPSANAETIKCGMQHIHSGTLKGASHLEILAHHEKFKIAQANYAKKWGLEEAFK